MDADTLIARVRARLPDAFLDSIDGLSGEELLPVFAAIFARASAKRVDPAKARLIRDATGPVHATGTVTVHFSEATGPDGYDIVTLVGDEPIRQALFATSWGLRFVLTEPLTRAPDAIAGDVVVTVEAEFAGWDGNVRAELVDEWAIPDLNNIDSLTFSVGSTEDAREEFFAGVRSGAITFSAGDMTGGRAGTLDLIAQGRGMPRAEGESDATLRKRLRAPPDMVTPNGLLRAVNKALGYDGATLVEYQENGFAWGIHGWGLHPWSRMMYAIIIVPAGSDVVALQELVNRIKAAGYYIKIVEAP